MEIEDEIYFVVQCPKYQTYRDNCFTYICKNVSKNFVNNDVNLEIYKVYFIYQ